MTHKKSKSVLQRVTWRAGRVRAVGTACARCALVLLAVLAALAVVPARALAATQEVEKVAIILQENTGYLEVLDVLDPKTRKAAEALVDGLAENFESLKTTLQVSERYDKIYNLTDKDCTRANLLLRLKEETKKGNIIDLFVYGHGDTDLLVLHGESLRGGLSGNLRSMLAEAKLEKFNLRLVYMCNCVGSTMNDDWLAVGADTSIGSIHLNIPEPQITNFVGNFVVNNMPARAAVEKAYADSLPFWVFVPKSIQESSRPVLAGNGNLRHTDKRLSVGETRKITVSASRTHNFAHLYGRAREKYSFKASSSDTWKNGVTVSGPSGYTPSILDALRRHANAGFNQMELVAEIFAKDDDALAFSGTFFQVGTSASHTLARDGYFCFFANDILTGYGDNSGSITLEVKRTK